MASQRGKSFARTFEIAGLAGVFALIQSHIIVLEFQVHGYDLSVNGALGVTTGHPYWREFQSRVLSPYLVLLLSKVTRNYVAAHFVFGLAALTLAGFLAWQMGVKVGRDTRSGLLSFIGLQAGFCCLLSPPWLYAWDYYGARDLFCFHYLGHRATLVVLVCRAILCRHS